MSESCIFCKIIKGTIPSHKLLETSKVFAFLDINPLSDGHAVRMF
jgi:diadenosine tetraphosphate (Ap4A) HIT family hydrolase